MLSISLYCNVGTCLDFISGTLQFIQELRKVFWLGSKDLVDLDTDAFPDICLLRELGPLLSGRIRNGFDYGQAMFQADQIADFLQRDPGAPEVPELPSAIHGS